MPDQLQAAIQAHNWYALVAIFITLFTQIVRKNNIPIFSWIWKKTPDGWRFIWPLLTGLATGLADGFWNGLPFTGALTQAFVGLLGIGAGSMGLAAVLKESPLRWDGAAGGRNTGVQ